MRQKARLTFGSFFRIVAQNTILYLLRFVLFLVYYTLRTFQKLGSFLITHAKRQEQYYRKEKYETDEMRRFVINQIIKL